MSELRVQLGSDDASCRKHRAVPVWPSGKSLSRNIIFSSTSKSRIYTSWNLLEWSLGPLVLEIMPQKVNLGLNNLVKWKEINCLNERVMSKPLALTKLYFVKSICVCFRKQLDLHQSLSLKGAGIRIKDWGQKCPCEGLEMENLPFILSTNHPITAALRGDSKHCPPPAQVNWDFYGILTFQVLFHTWRSPQQHGLKQKVGVEIPVAILSHLILLWPQERNALLSHAMLICALYAWSQLAPSLS